jgi:4-oxalocrotonate tautomerase
MQKIFEPAERRMPLVHVSLQQGRTPAQKKAISNAIYRAMRETINIPENDHFVFLDERSTENVFVDETFMGFQRTAEALVIEITLRKGRTTELKQALYRRITELLAADAGVSGSNVIIVLQENDSADWSFGGGIAQFVV